jgi:hypothetical protein
MSGSGLALLAAVLGPASLAEPAPPPAGWPAPGEVVRVAEAGGPRRRGTLVAVERDALVVSLDRDRPPTQIPLASIDRLEVARGRRSAAREGAALGALAGAACGAVLTTAFGKGLCGGGAHCGVSTGWVLGGAGVFAAAGAAVGSLVGLPFQKDRWEPVALDRVRVTLAPARRGAGAQVTLAW